MGNDKAWEPDLSQRTFRFDSCSFNAQPQAPAQRIFRNGASRRLRLGVKRRIQTRYDPPKGEVTAEITTISLRSDAVRLGNGDALMSIDQRLKQHIFILENI